MRTKRWLDGAVMMVVGLGCGLAATACGDDTSTSGASDGGTATLPTGTGGMGAGGMGSGGAGGTVNGWTGELPDLYNDAACSDPSEIAPASTPNEAGHLYAVRLTPPQYPFQVDEIVYELVDDGTPCSASQAHRVELYVDSAVAPPSDSDPIATLPIDPSADAQDGVVRKSLAAPITLNDGEHLFVAVELPQPTTSCLAVCYGATVFDRDYWSNAAMRPYAWTTLQSSTFNVHARVGANGM